MTTPGWIFLGIAWGGVVAVMAFCIVKTLTVKRDTGPDEEDDQ